MRTCLLLGISSIVLGSSFANGDALLLLANARTAQEDTPAPKAVTEEYATGMYVRTGIGGNLMTNINPKVGGNTYEMTGGVDLNASFGYRFTKILGVELQTGFAWNGFYKTIQGSKSESIGGQIYQVPIAANFVVTIPLSEGNYEPLFGRGAELLLLTGAGGQWTSAKSEKSSTGSPIFDIDDWTWRFQAGLVLSAYLAKNTKFGVYFTYSRTGDLTGSAGPGSGLPVGSDYSLAALNNFAVGLSVSFRF